ncbi:MAG: crossover junction endodeoxyribonuclease RuvC [Gemmatimonadetes bacterium]|nr:crossover junction endodeoxyribonuclease RuvC [Gemmatimonadota bacterium]
MPRRAGTGPEMRVVALDPSLAATGVAVDPGIPPHVIAPPRGVVGAARLAHIDQRIREAVDGADLVVLEGYSYGSKGTAAYQLGELGGVIRLALHRMRTPLAVVSPAAVKMLATGRGNAAKEAVFAAAIRRLGYQGSSTHEADALWLLEAALQRYGLPGAVKLPKTHLRALGKIAWPGLGEAVKRGAA